MAINLKDLSDSDRKSIKSWYYYDWANSAHSTSVMVAKDNLSSHLGKNIICLICGGNIESKLFTKIIS